MSDRYWNKELNRPYPRRRYPEEVRDVVEPTQLLSDGRDAGKVFEIIHNKHHTTILFVDHVPKKTTTFQNPLFISAVAWAKEYGAETIIFYDRGRRRMTTKRIAEMPNSADRYFNLQYEMADEERLPNTHPWFDVPTCTKTVELYRRDPRETGTQPNLLGE